MSIPKRRRIEEKSTLSHLLSVLGSDTDSVMNVLLALEEKGADVEGAVREILREDHDQSRCKLFIRSLSWNTNADQVREVFQEYGEIVDLVVLEKDGKSRGFGFVTFSNAEEAARALEEPRKIIDGRETICNLASKPDDHAKRSDTMPGAALGGAGGGGLGGGGGGGQLAVAAAPMTQDQKDASRLFVRSLNWNTDQETLRAAFAPYGPIVDCAVIFDKDTGKSKGYGFVTFADPASAKEALQQPEKTIDGRKTYCNLASERKRASSVMTQMDPTMAYYQNMLAMGGQQQYMQQPVMQQQLQMQQLAMQQQQQPGGAGVTSQPTFATQFPASTQQWATTQLATNPQPNYGLLIQQQVQQLAAATGQPQPQGMQAAATTIQSPTGVSTIHQLTNEGGYP